MVKALFQSARMGHLRKPLILKDDEGMAAMRVQTMVT